MSRPAERYREIRARGGIADLSDRVKLRLTGADRVRYLNGQVTANVQRLTAGEARPACVLTAKGKLCADVFLHAVGDALFVDAEAGLRETLAARLERYLITDEVEIEDVTDTWQLFHVLGEPPASFTSRANRIGRSGFDVLIPRGQTLETLRPSDVLDEALLETLRVEVGVPRWGRELDEDTLPPEAGLDRTHIDYHKGCYVGQEVISRLKSVGHVNRRLIGFVADDGEPLVAGLRLFAPGKSAREVGCLTSAAWSFALDRPVALGYLRRGSPPGDLLACAPDDPGPGRLVSPRELPLVS